jgi:hypothetical protein
VQLFGDQIEPNDIDNVQNLFRRVFEPILRKPSDPTIGWLFRMVKDMISVQTKVTRDAKNEFSERLQSVMANKGSLSEASVGNLIEIARILGFAAYPATEPSEPDAGGPSGS